MIRRLLPCVALLGLLALPSPARPADDKKPAAPGFIVRVQSLDDLLNNYHYLATLVGREAEAKQFEDKLKEKAGGPKGLEGIDAKRPMAVYGSFGENGLDSTAVALIPIADEKAFLGLIENLGAKAEKGEDGLYTVTSENLPTPAYFRFAHKHAYVTAKDKDVIDKDKLLAPGTVLPAGKTGVFSASVRIDQVPDGLHKLAVGQVELQLDNAKDENKDKETEAQHELKVQFLDWLKEQVVSVLNEGGELALRLDVDQKAKELSVELALRGKDGTALEKTIADLGKHKSTVAGIIGPDSIMNFQFDVPASDKTRKALQAVFEEGLRKTIAEEKDKDKKEQAEKVFKAMQPALKGMEGDWALDFRGPSKGGLYTLVSGMKTSDGAALEKSLREAFKDLPGKDAPQVKFDVEKAGDVSIHRIDMKGQDDEFKKSFGDGPAYFAVRSDAAFLAFGDDALGAVKQALKVEPKVGRPAQFEISVARLAEVMAKEKPEAPKAAAKAFGKDKGADKIRFALEAGQELKLRFVMKAPVLTFFHLMEPNADVK